MSVLQQDPLDEQFRELEAEVRRRECEHPTWLEVTVTSDPLRRWLCPDCGSEQVGYS